MTLALVRPPSLTQADVFRLLDSAWTTAAAWARSREQGKEQEQGQQLPDRCRQQQQQQWEQQEQRDHQELPDEATRHPPLVESPPQQQQQQLPVEADDVSHPPYTESPPQPQQPGYADPVILQPQQSLREAEAHFDFVYDCQVRGAAGLGGGAGWWWRSMAYPEPYAEHTRLILRPRAFQLWAIWQNIFLALDSAKPPEGCGGWSPL